MFPRSVPFVCWIQDHLPNLRGKAGRLVGPNDFVLTDAVHTYANDSDYPPRQLIAMSKLTSVTMPPAAAGSARGNRDVVFVSNASRDPRDLLSEWRAAFTGPARHGELVATAGRQIMERY